MSDSGSYKKYFASPTVTGCVWTDVWVHTKVQRMAVTFGDRNTASGAHHLLVGPRTASLGRNRGLVVFLSSLHGSDVHPKQELCHAPHLYRAIYVWQAMGNGHSACVTRYRQLCWCLHLGSLLLFAASLRDPTSSSKQFPRKHLHACHRLIESQKHLGWGTCHTVLPCPEHSLPSTFCLPHCQGVEGAMQVMLPQLHRKAGW